MKTIQVVLLTSLVLCSFKVLSKTGNDLQCDGVIDFSSNNTPPYNSEVCVGLAGPVLEVLPNADICADDETTLRQLILVVQKYLNEHPEKLHLDSNELVLMALVTSFPCENKGR
tara:strand:+ start:428 stop:769 length:342 start_codon:yes stop_codon:yes gene_type:complete